MTLDTIDTYSSSSQVNWYARVLISAKPTSWLISRCNLAHSRLRPVTGGYSLAVLLVGNLDQVPNHRWRSHRGGTSEPLQEQRPRPGIQPVRGVGHRQSIR